MKRDANSLPVHTLSSNRTLTGVFTFTWFISILTAASVAQSRAMSYSAFLSLSFIGYLLKAQGGRGLVCCCIRCAVFLSYHMPFICLSSLSSVVTWSFHSLVVHFVPPLIALCAVYAAWPVTVSFFFLFVCFWGSRHAKKWQKCSDSFSGTWSHCSVFLVVVASSESVIPESYMKCAS